MFMAASTLAELSYEAAVRALDLQERAVEQLRARTGTLLAASSLTASFLGAQTIARSSGLGVLGGLALVSLAASIGLCVYILLPKKEFTFSLNAPQVYEQLFAVRDDEEEIRRRLVYWLEDFWQANQIKVDELGRYYLAAAVALGLQLSFGQPSLPLTSPNDGRPSDTYAASSSGAAAAWSWPPRDTRRSRDLDEVAQLRPCPFRRSWPAATPTSQAPCAPPKRSFGGTTDLAVSARVRTGCSTPQAGLAASVAGFIKDRKCWSGPTASLLRPAEQAPTEVEGALSQLVQLSSELAGPAGARLAERATAGGAC